MPAPATSVAAAAAAASFLPKQPYISSSLPIPARIPSLAASRRSLSVGVRIRCQVAAPTDVASSSSLSDEELEAESKVGRRIRVKSPLKVYHVPRAPDLDLEGMEGVIKQYVGVWKGKRISANLPFKAEFFVEVPGQEKPVKVVAHLKEDESEYGGGWRGGE